MEGAPPSSQGEEETLDHRPEAQSPILPPLQAEQEDNAAKSLELATELFNQGLKAVEDGDFVDAVDCFSRALEIRLPLAISLAFGLGLGFPAFLRP